MRRWQKAVPAKDAGALDQSLHPVWPDNNEDNRSLAEVVLLVSEAELISSAEEFF
jgi:hypothetical protein